MRRRSAAAVLALFVVGGGCSFDLTEIQYRQEARFALRLDFLERGGPLVVSGSFDPGRTREGRIRPLGDDSMRVNGVAVAPTEVRSDGQRRYWIAGLNASAPLLFRPPLVASLPDAPPEFAVEVMRIVAPDTLIVARPGTIEIGLIGVSDVRDRLTRGSWTLQVYADTGRFSVLSLNGNTPPPPILRIASDLLPNEFGRGRLEVRGQTQDSIASVTGSYEITVFRIVSGSIPLRIRD